MDRIAISDLGDIDLSRNQEVIILIGKIDEVKGLTREGAFILTGNQRLGAG